MEDILNSRKSPNDEKKEQEFWDSGNKMDSKNINGGSQKENFKQPIRKDKKGHRWSFQCLAFI